MTRATHSDVIVVQGRTANRRHHRFHPALAVSRSCPAQGGASSRSCAARRTPTPRLPRRFARYSKRRGTRCDTTRRSMLPRRRSLLSRCRTLVNNAGAAYYGLLEHLRPPRRAAYAIYVVAPLASTARFCPRCASAAQGFDTFRQSLIASRHRSAFTLQRSELSTRRRAECARTCAAAKRRCNRSAGRVSNWKQLQEQAAR